jgi:hypothetical protein
MIIWINGPFGIGKTHTAFELHRRIPGSQVFDPEKIGYFARKIIPKNLAKADFQDYPFWRSANREMLDYLDRDGSVIIVPMTLVSAEYYDQIIAPLKAGHDVRHFTLMASKQTVEDRLKKRFDGKAWNFYQVDRCLAGLADKRFEEYVDTEAHGLYEVVELIAKRCRISLVPDKRPGFQKSLDRLQTTLRHL